MNIEFELLKREFTANIFLFSSNMEAIYSNHSTDLCNAIMMELMEIEKHIMETTRGYLPISLYNAIMLLMENEKQIKLETLCSKFLILLYNARMLLMGNEKQIDMETTRNNKHVYSA